MLSYEKLAGIQSGAEEKLLMRQRISGFVASAASSSKPEEGKGRLVYFISHSGGEKDSGQALGWASANLRNGMCRLERRMGKNWFSNRVFESYR